MQACLSLDGTFRWPLPQACSANRRSKAAPQLIRWEFFLHYFIACSAAGIYYLASRKLPFLREFPLVCGLFFGAAVEDVMRFIVLPLSALHSHGPYKFNDLILGLLVHMVVVGLPISYSIRRFALAGLAASRETPR